MCVYSTSAEMGSKTDTDSGLSAFWDFKNPIKAEIRLISAKNNQFRRFFTVICVGQRQRRSGFCIYVD